MSVKGILKKYEIDHRDKDRSNNTMENLQTLCLSCHGRKDIIPRLTQRKVEAFKNEIMFSRANGESYESLACRLRLSTASIWKWNKKWGGL